MFVNNLFKPRREGRKVRECQKKCAFFDYAEYWPLRGTFQNNYPCLKQRNPEISGVFNYVGPGSYLDRVKYQIARKDDMKLGTRMKFRSNVLTGIIFHAEKILFKSVCVRRK